MSGRGGWRWRNARVGLGLVDKLDCDFAKSRKQRRGSEDTWHAGLSLIHDEDRRSGRLRLDTFFKSFCTLACLGYCCCCMAIEPFQAVLLQVCVWVCTRCWGSEALMRSIVIQGAFTQATPAGSPGTSPLKWRPPPRAPVLWSHSAGQGNRAVWEEVERKQQRGIRARSRSDQKKWKQGIINWERGQWEFYTKIRFTLEQTSWQLVRARYLRKKQTILLYKWFIQLNLNMKWFSWMHTGIFILNDGNPDRLDWKDVLHHWLK